MNVLRAVEAAGARAWLVGDAARMVVMGIEPEVMTLAVDSPDLSKLAKALGGTLDSRGTFPVLRGTVAGTPFRGLRLEGGSIEEDLARRDLSINAIALRSDGGTVDPFGGRLDVRNRVIRLTGDDIELVHRDPLRIVRMLRFASELGMDIFWKSDADVRTFLESHIDEIRKMPAERWGREIMSGTKRRPLQFIRLCDAYHLLPIFLKDLDALKQVPDGRGGTIFDHVLAVLGVIQDRIGTHKVMEKDAFILAGLFSRIGTRSLEDREMTPARERLISDYLKRWNVPAETIGEATAIIGGYRRFYEPRDEEQMCGYVLEQGMDAVEAGMEFARCVVAAEGLPFAETIEENQWNLAQVLRRFGAVASQMDGATRYLTGGEVMKMLGMSPGRKVGELLNDLDMAVGIGIVASRAEAEDWVRTYGA